MIKAMSPLVVLLLFLFTHCGENGEPDPASSLFGKWKLEKIRFETDASKSEINVPSTYDVPITFLDDGNYAYMENGQEQKRGWKMVDTNQILVKDASNQDRQLDINISEDGASWSYLAAEIDFTKAITDMDRQVADFVTLMALSQGKSLETANAVKVFFVMKKKQ